MQGAYAVLGTHSQGSTKEHIIMKKIKNMKKRLHSERLLLCCDPTILSQGSHRLGDGDW